MLGFFIMENSDSKVKEIPLKAIGIFQNDDIVIIFLNNKSMKWILKRPIAVNFLVANYIKKYSKEYIYIDFHRLNEIDLSILSQQMQKELFTLNEKNK